MQKRNMSLLFMLLLSNKISFAENNVDDSQHYKMTKKPHVYYNLKSPFLEKLDGIANRLDGNAIDEVMQVRKMIRDLQTKGIIDEKTKKCLNHSIEDFVELERNGQAGDLTECLKAAKNQFIDSTEKFMQRIDVVKKIVIKLIEESCKLRKISQKDTILFDWANTTHGNERVVFNEKIRTFREFDKFLEHVFGFLGDLIKSCRKGFKQYKQQFKK